eukprot:7001345-Prymnesium_polylepis.2
MYLSDVEARASPDAALARPARQPAGLPSSHPVAMRSAGCAKSPRRGACSQEGGETNFTKLNLSIAPAKGSAIVWPSVLCAPLAPHSDLHPSQPRQHTSCVRGLAIERWCAPALLPCALREPRSNDPYTTDERTYHEAVPVVRGLKFAANFWMHMYDFQNPLAVGCDNVNYVQPSALRGADM